MNIPHIIHQTWKDHQIPYRVFKKAWIDSWKRHHTTWEFRFWTDTDLRELIAQQYPWFLPAYDRYPHNIQRVDAARYFILHRYGGLYADLDIECFRPVDPLLEGYSAVFQWGPRNITNAIMASSPGLEIWDEVFQRLAARSGSDKVISSTGPKLLTDSLQGLHLGELEHSQVRILPFGKYFFPYAARDQRHYGHLGPEHFAADIYGAHRFAATWIKRSPAEQLLQFVRHAVSPLRHPARRLVFKLVMDPWIRLRTLRARRRVADARAYVVVGAESSGTRMLTRFFLHSGCDGDGNHRQRFDWKNPNPTSKLVVWRRSFPHSGMRCPNVPLMVRLLERLGYEVTIVEIRRSADFTAHSQSRRPLMAHDIQHAQNRLAESHAQLDQLAEQYGARFFRVNYEQFVSDRSYREAFARQMGIPFNEVEDYSNRNEKYASK